MSGISSSLAALKAAMTVRILAADHGEISVSSAWSKMDDILTFRVTTEAGMWPGALAAPPVELATTVVPGAAAALSSAGRPNRSRHTLRMLPHCPSSSAESDRTGGAAPTVPPGEAGAGG